MNFSSHPQGFHSGKRAFTLIELLTVIAIIGILAAILIPVVGKVRDQAKFAQCAVHMRDLGSAMHLYANDHYDRLPPFLRGGTPQSEWGSRVDIHGHLGLLLAPEKGGPIPPGWEQWSGDYLDSAEPLMCPASLEKLYGTATSGGDYKRASEITPTNRLERIGYMYDFQFGGTWDNSRTTIDNPNRPFVFDFPAAPFPASAAFTINPHNGRVNVLHVGGHVTSFSTADISAAGSRLNVYRLMAGEL